MKVYNYDRRTKEYIGSENAYLDKAATLREGKEIYLLPAFATFVSPPDKKEKNQVFVWNGRKWEIKEDYRGQVIYNINTREGKVCTEIGPLPTEYVLNLKPSVAEIQNNYLNILKANFNQYLKETKITIPNLNLVFNYLSLPNIKNEKELGLIASRDDNNQIYTNLTDEQYNGIIDYLTTFGQLVYIYKWNVENSIKKCNNIELLEGLKDKLTIKIDMKHLNNLMKMPADKRKEYIARNANNIK